MKYALRILSPWIFSIAVAKSPAAANIKEKLNCSEKEIARQDCRLVLGNYNIRLLPKTVAWSDGTWHTVDEMPLAGEAAAWERAHFQRINGWPLLQLWLWDKGVGETQVQSLHWYVADAEKRKLTIVSEGVVRRRRPEAVEPAPKKNAVPKFLYDGWEPHGVRSGKNGTLEWWIAGQKKTLQRPNKDSVKHGI